MRLLSKLINERLSRKSNLKPLIRHDGVERGEFIAPPNYCESGLEEDQDQQTDEKESYYYCCDCDVVNEDFGIERSNLQNSSVHSVQFSGDGRKILFGLADSSIHISSLGEKCENVIIKPSRNDLGMPITCLRSIPMNEYWFVGCSSHGDVFSFSLEHPNFETLIRENQETYCLEATADGSKLITGGNDCYLRIYNLTPSGARGFQQMGHDYSKVNSTTDINKNQVYGERWIKHPNENKKTFLPQHANLAHLCCTNDDYSPIYADTITPNNELNMYSAQTDYVEGRPNYLLDKSAKNFEETSCFTREKGLGICNANYPKAEGFVLGRAKSDDVVEQSITTAHSMRIMAIKSHPENGHIFASASWDRFIKIWDSRVSRECVHQIFGPQVSSPDAMDMDSLYILTASHTFKNSLALWDMRSMKGCPAQVIDAIATDDKYTNLEDLQKKCSLIHEGRKGRFNVAGCSAWDEGSHENQRGEYIHAVRIISPTAIACGGAGFKELRVVSRNTNMPLARYPVASTINSMDVVFDGRKIGLGTVDGSVHVVTIA